MANDSTDRPRGSGYKRGNRWKTGNNWEPKGGSPAKGPFTLDRTVEVLGKYGYRLSARYPEYVSTTAVSGPGGIRWHISAHIPEGRTEPILVLCVWFGPGVADWATKTLGGVPCIGDAALVAERLANIGRLEAEANRNGTKDPSPSPEPPAGDYWYVFNPERKLFLAKHDGGYGWTNKYDSRALLSEAEAKRLADKVDGVPIMGDPASGQLPLF